MNARSRDALRTFATELPPDSPECDGRDPIDFAQRVVEHNNEHNGAALDYSTEYFQAPDHSWCHVAWVYDTGPAPRLCRHCSDPLNPKDPPVDIITGESFCGANPDNDRHEVEHGGDVVMCWWQRTTCPDCDGYQVIELFHPSTDALIGHRPCPETHPTCGKCEACRWVIKNGAYDEVTGRLSRPACTGPPPPVSLVKPHLCDDPWCCPPF